MIKLDIQPLPRESAVKLNAWLDRPECELLKNCILAKIHEQSAKATNYQLQRPEYDQDGGSLPQGAIKAMSEASAWKIALDKINELSIPGYEFTTINSTSYSHARHD